MIDRQMGPRDSCKSWRWIYVYLTRLTTVTCGGVIFDIVTMLKSLWKKVFPNGEVYKQGFSITK